MRLLLTDSVSRIQYDPGATNEKLKRRYNGKNFKKGKRKKKEQCIKYGVINGGGVIDMHNIHP